MVTLTPLSQLKKVKAPKRSRTSLVSFIMGSVIFSNIVTSTLMTKSPEFMFSEFKELAKLRQQDKMRGPKLSIILSCGNKIGVQVGSLQKDL